MNCGANTIKYLLFIFNLIFALCGLGLLIYGVLRHIGKNSLPDDTFAVVTISIIVLGSIVFVIAFFGCCGAIQEQQCMVITYAIFLLIILIIQVALAILVFMLVKNINPNEITKSFDENVKKYWQDDNPPKNVDFIQNTFQCCGTKGPDDYNNKYPWSCCPVKNDNRSGECQSKTEVYNKGCSNIIVSELKYGGKILGGVVLGIAGIELFGVIAALCLSNSIKNEERRSLRI